MSKKRISKKLKNSIRIYIASLRFDKLPIEKVLLFGSYARGNQNQWSDVDLCIISPKFSDTWKATQYLWKKLPFNSDFIFEPVGFNPKDFADDSPLISQIKKTGIEVK